MEIIVTPEDWITILLPLVWAGFMGLPLLGVTISEDKQTLFEKICNCYLRFALFFTIGSFLFLIANDQWTSFMSYLMNGQMWMLHVVVPSIFWVGAGYYFYSIWRDVVKGAKVKKDEKAKASETVKENKAGGNI
jgi:hypothetical protein